MPVITLDELRKMILEVSSDNELHTRQELIAHAQEKYGMRLYDADQRVTAAIKSLLKSGTLSKLEKGVYQMQDVPHEMEPELLENNAPQMDHTM